MNTSRLRYQVQDMSSQQLQLGDLAALRDATQETNQKVKKAVDKAQRLQPIVIESLNQDIINPLDYFLDNPQFGGVHDMVELCIQLSIPVTEQLFYIRYFVDDQQKFALFVDRLAKLVQYFQQIALWTSDYRALSKQFVALLSERSRNTKQLLKLYAAITTLQIQIFSFANEANTVQQKKIRATNVIRPLFDGQRLAQFCYQVGLSGFQISQLQQLTEKDFYNYQLNFQQEITCSLTPRMLNSAFQQKLQQLGLRLDLSEITQEMVEQSQHFYREEADLFKKYTEITQRLPVGYFLTQVVLEDSDSIYVFDSNRLYARLSTGDSQIGVGLENTNLLPFDQRLKIIQQKEQKARNERRHADLPQQTDKDLKELQEIRQQKRLQKSLKAKVKELKQKAIKIKNKALLDVELMKQRQMLQNTQVEDTLQQKLLEQSRIAEQEKSDKPQVELAKEKQPEVALSSIETDGQMLDFQRSLDSVKMALSHLENPQLQQKFVPGFADQQQASRHNSVNSLQNNSLTPNLPSNFVYDPRTQKYKEETQLKLEQQLQEYKNKIYNGLENLQQQVLAGNVLAAGMNHSDRMHFLTESQRNLRSPFSEQHENSDVAKKIADQIIADQNARERARLKAIRMRSQQKQRKALTQQKGRNTKSQQPKSPIKLSSPVQKSASPQEIEMVRIPRRPSQQSGSFSPKIAKISDADLVRDQEVLERVPSANMSSLRLKQQESVMQSMLQDDSKPDVDIGHNESVNDGNYSRKNADQSIKAQSPLSVQQDDVQEQEEEELMEAEEEMEEQEEEMEEEEDADENE